MSDELPVGAGRRQWLTLFICIGTVGILCVGFYFLLVSRVGLPARTAIFLAGATFVISVVAAVCGALRIEKAIVWIGAGFVVVMLATMIHLGMSFILVAALAALHAVGLPISDMLVEVVGLSVGLGRLFHSRALQVCGGFCGSGLRRHSKEKNPGSKTFLDFLPPQMVEIQLRLGWKNGQLLRLFRFT